MKYRPMLWLGAASILFAVGCGQTQEQPERQAQGRQPFAGPGFNQLDANDDGFITRQEAGRLPRLEENFAKIDDNNDGRITRAEYLEAAAGRDFTWLREQAADFVDPGKKTETGYPGSSAGSGAAGATKEK